jgi:PAS domain S-box-containing protein
MTSLLEINTELRQIEEALRESEARLADQKQALELALSGAPLHDVLDVLVRAGQRQFGGDSRTGIFIVDAEGAHLRFAAAADLSKQYADAVDSFPIAPQEPSCGRAAYTGQTEIVQDVESDPLWTPYLELAREHDIRACWSFPLHSAEGKVIGTYAVYHRTPRAPEARDLERVALLLQTAAIIIERHKEAEVRAQAEAALRESEADALFLAALGERIRLTRDPAELLYEVARALGDSLEVRRSFFVEIDEARDRGVVRRDYCRGVESVAGEYRISEYSSITLLEVAAGRTVVNCDSQKDPRTAATYDETYRERGERAYVSVPLMREGRWSGILWISTDQPRRWQPREVSLVEMVAERTWNAVERLRVDAELRVSEERYRSLTQILTSVVWHTDPAGRFTVEQPEWAAFTGQTWEEYRGEGWANALHPDDRERVRELWRRALETRSHYQAAGRLWHAPTGGYRYFVGRALPLLDAGGTIREWIGTITDVDEQKKGEEALKESDRRKDEFLATLSHELRTPLTSGYGWVKLLAHAPDMLETGLQAIDNSFVSQIKLVDDLLDVSRIVAGKLPLDLQPCDLTGVVHSAVEMVRPSAHVKPVDLRLRIHSVPVVLGDASRLKQVVWNLLSNAIKFTPPGGVVEVHLRQAGPNAQVVVRDSGEGIDATFLPHVFARFRQADGTINRKHGGLGLGLSIVASLVEAHNGEVHAESDGPGQGATFTLTIPLIEQSELVRPAFAHGPGERGAQSLGGLRVLVVDDDAGARQLMSKTLEAYGAEVHECASAREAHAVLPQWPPDVIVSDLAMPGEDGYSLIRRLRESGNLVPAVAVTAYVRSEDEARVREAGFQRHVPKPFDPQVLVEAVRDLVRA